MIHHVLVCDAIQIKWRRFFKAVFYIYIKRKFNSKLCVRLWVYILSTRSRGYWEYEKSRKLTPIMKC